MARRVRDDECVEKMIWLTGQHQMCPAQRSPSRRFIENPERV